MRVLVTGAAGYLGSELYRELTGDFALTLVDVVPPSDAGARKLWLPCDLTDQASVTGLVAGHDAVVHTVAIVRNRAGLPIAPFLDVTVGGTWNVLDAAARGGVGRVVNISSIVAGGAHDETPVGTDGWGPLAPSDLYYGLSKRLGEVIADSYAAAYPAMSVVNLRPVMIAGDGQNAEPAPSPDGIPRFMHVDVRDVARAVRAALMTTPAPTGAYNVTAARSDSVYDWTSAQTDLGFTAENNWEQVP